MRTQVFWALPASKAMPPCEYLLVKQDKNENGKKLPRPTGALEARVYHPIKKAQGRRKGSALEIEVAGVLNQFFFNGLKILRRTPLSGGWSQGMGDICCDPEQMRKNKVAPPNIYVECKKGQGISYESLLNWAYFGKPAMYTGWWAEAKRQCSDKIPMLVVQGDDQDAWVIASRAIADLVRPRISLHRHSVVLLPLEDLARQESVAKERDGDTGNIQSG